MKGLGVGRDLGGVFIVMKRRRRDDGRLSSTEKFVIGLITVVVVAICVTVFATVYYEATKPIEPVMCRTIGNNEIPCPPEVSP